MFNFFIYSEIILESHIEEKDINNYVCNSMQAQVIIDGKYYQIDANDLNKELCKILSGSYQMPALGVSIHTEILKAIKQGIWLKLQYNGTQVVDDMFFDELLIEVNPEFSGVNVIRGNCGIYEGRCFYIYGLNMNTLYDFIKKKYIVDKTV